MLLRGGVLLGEAHHQGAHARAEVRLFGDDDLAGAKVARERPRAAAAAQVVRGGRADERDPDDLEQVAEPPAEVHERQHQRAVDRRGEEGEPDDHREISGAARQQERRRRADGDRGEEDEPDGDQRPGRGRTRRGHGRDEARREHADQAEARDLEDDDDLERDRLGDRLRRVEVAKTRENEDRRAHRQGRPTAQGDQPVRADEHTGRHEPVHGEQRRHDGEGAADNHRAAVADPRSGHRQRDRRRRGREGGDADTVEVHPERRHDHALAEERQERHRDGGARRQKGNDREQPPQHQRSLSTVQAPDLTPG